MSIRSSFNQLREGMSRTTVVSAIPLVFIVAAGGLLSYRSHAVLRNDRDMVVHTYQVIGATRDAMLAAEEAETSQRGFIITGNPAFLALYQKARQKAEPASLADLQRLLIRNPRQQLRLARLHRLIDQKFDEIEKTINARRSQNFEAARVLIATPQGKDVMDDIRELVSKMDYEEQNLLKERSGRASASESRIVWVAAVMTAISITARIALAIRAIKPQ